MTKKKSDLQSSRLGKETTLINRVRELETERAAYKKSLQRCSQANLALKARVKQVALEMEEKKQPPSNITDEVILPAVEKVLRPKSDPLVFVNNSFIIEVLTVPRKARSKIEVVSRRKLMLIILQCAGFSRNGSFVFFTVKNLDELYRNGNTVVQAGPFENPIRRIILTGEDWQFFKTALTNCPKPYFESLASKEGVQTNTSDTVLALIGSKEPSQSLFPNVGLVQADIANILAQIKKEFDIKLSRNSFRARLVSLDQNPSLPY